MGQPAPGVGTPPPARRRRGGCLGCLIPLLLIVVIIAGAIYFFAVAAAAAVSIPAQLLVLQPQTTLVHGGSAQPAKSGALVHAGDVVRNDAAGRSLVQFADGSIVRVAPSSQITLDSADFDKSGKLSNVSISQQSGRTLSTVEKLVGGGAKFTVSGHSANASVRGTKFEVIQNPDGSFRLKVYAGVVRLSGSSGGVDVPAGQQADASPAGAVGKPAPIAPDPADPFTLWLASEEAAKAAGQPATAQTSFDSTALASGQTAAQPDYNTAGGEVVGTLAYPGSTMTLNITDPSGAVHSVTGGNPGPNGKLAVVDIPNGPGGAYKVSVTGNDVNPAEHFSVTLVTKFVCAATGNQASQGGYVRSVLSANQTRDALVQNGASSVSISFGSASAGGAVVSGSGSFNGVSVAGAGLLYAGPGGTLGVTVTSARVNGIDVKQQISSALAQATGHNLDAIDLGFSVDRVFSCSGGGDNFLVIEGHSPTS